MRYGFRKMLIGGEWLAGKRKEVFPAIDRGTGEILAEVARGYVVRTAIFEIDCSIGPKPSHARRLRRRV